MVMLQTTSVASQHAAVPAAALAPQQQRSCRRPGRCRAMSGPAPLPHLQSAAAAGHWPQPAALCIPRHSLVQQRRAARGCAVRASAASGGSSTLLTVPTMLTLARVAAIPALVACWYSTAPWAAAACTTLFVGASLTDYLDGYLARKMNASSAFGAFLDPVADKLMVATTLILMCTRPLPLGVMAGNTWLVPLLTCVVIGREITMSALREWAAALGPEAHSAVAVSWVGKWKTAAQMTSLTLLLVAHQGASSGSSMPPALLQAAGAGGVPLLIVATVLTAWSLALYFAGLWRFF